MKRRLLRHGPIALLAGVLVYALLNVTAWYNLRDQRNVCRRQGYTRQTFRVLEQQLFEHRQRQGDLPAVLTELPELPPGNLDPNGQPLDEWGHPIQYRHRPTAAGFELFSFGRDGRPGGIGLDADLYADGRNHEQSLATFRQFFIEADRAEVDRGGFQYAGLLAGGMVVWIVFGSLGDLDDKEKPLRPVTVVIYAGVIIIIATLIGGFLLPVHIPNGH